MTIYRTCTGCVREKQPCEAREALRGHLKGTGVTSIKWKCRERISRFAVGDAVWARTVASHATDDYGKPYCDDFPATVIRLSGAKCLVFIRPGILGRGGDDIFEPTQRGFCKIPLSRLAPRDAPRQPVCHACKLPESEGHAEGYSCHYAEEQRKRKAEIENV